MSILIFILLFIPAASAGACLVIPRARSVLQYAAAASGSTLAITVFIALRFVAGTTAMVAGHENFRIDAMSAYHLVIMATVFFASSVFAISYFDDAIADGHVSTRTMRRYGALWMGSLAAMTLVLVSNNLGLMWVAIESTTLVTAFLISVHRDAHTLEAMWKYLIVCSVGIALAFMGTLFCAVAAANVDTGGTGALLWDHLFAARTHLDPLFMRVGFIFVIVGYGTKAGLAPMHTWLPDAHSQAPAPVSAMFSGFMLNAALYCILRYLALVEGAVPGFGMGLLVVFGLVSILLAAAFITFQQDAKRLLAYHSVEHLGIIALGFGLGPIGAQAALFHTLNHSVCKSLGFFSVGRLGQMYGTHDMHRIKGAFSTHPIWGIGLLGSLLALIGVAPFAIFLSEFQLLLAAAKQGAWVVLSLFLLGTGIVFVSAFRHTIDMTFGKPPEKLHSPQGTFAASVIVVGSLGLLLVLGLWMPPELHDMIIRAAMIVDG